VGPAVEPAPIPESREALTASTAPEPALGPTAVDVVVTWARDGSPARDVPVEVTSADAEPFPFTRARHTDGDGLAHFEGLAAGEQRIDSLLGGWEGVELSRGETRTVALAIPRGVDVDCSVIDNLGQPVPRAEIWFGYGRSPGTILGMTDVRGHLLVRDVGRSRALAASATGFAPSAQRPVRGNPGDRIALTLTLGGPGAALQGTVRDETGSPIAGAELQVDTKYYQQVTLPDGTRADGPPEVRLIADSNGRFAAEGLAPVKLELSVRAVGFAPRETELAFVPGETTHAEVILLSEAHVTGTVRDAAGAPVAGAAITGAANFFHFTGGETRSAADGTFTLRGMARGECKLGAHHEVRGRAQTTLVIPADGIARWDPVLTAGESLAGRVLDEGDRPLEGWHVAAAERSEPGLWLNEDYADASGAFELVDCPRKPFVLAVRSPAEPFGDPIVLFDAFRPGDQELVIHVPDADVPSATVTGQMVSADGNPLVQPRVGCVSELSGFGMESFPGELGRFRIGPMRPGRYALRIEADGMGSANLEPFELRANETHDVGTVVLERAGRLHVRLRIPEGSAAPDHLRTRGSWCAPDAHFEVVPGAETELELVLEPATSRVVAFTLPAGDAAVRLHVIVRDAQGRTVQDYDGYERLEAGTSPLAFRLGVGPLVIGSYSVEARTDTGRVAAGSLSVTSLERADEPLVLPLR
jgi:hypothetical protein